MSLPDAVILDMDGLMYDTERIWQMFWSPVLLKRGIWYDPAQGPACSATNGKVKQDILRSFYGDDWDVEGACREFSAMAKAHLAMLRPHKKPGLDELLAYLKEHDIPASTSSSPGATSTACLWPSPRPAHWRSSGTTWNARGSRRTSTPS